MGKALPDTLVWRDELDYNEPYINNYLRHPAFNNYPVVGVSWEQANDFCKWRTDRVNEKILIDYHEFWHQMPTKEIRMSLQPILISPRQYAGKQGKRAFDSKRDSCSQDQMEDGVLLPLPPSNRRREYAYQFIGK